MTGQAKTLEATTANVQIDRVRLDTSRPGALTRVFAIRSDMLSLRLQQAAIEQGRRVFTFVQVRNGMDWGRVSVREGVEQALMNVRGNHGHAYRLGVDEQGPYAEVQRPETAPPTNEFPWMRVQAETIQ
ncbi:hypothetical protein HY992_02860 [Candidatus Micrarchaeota archaeon]|nr:hypothetical protein [Candidatus Micrarchaeota archaeon]